uniref:Uncharacterized protein n=1 Tax=Glossina austeni TaxID=7395 RepID=A0A1A9UN72_GLOAU
MPSSFYGRECSCITPLMSLKVSCAFVPYDATIEHDKDKVYATISIYLTIRCVLGMVCAVARLCIDTHIINHVADFLKVQHAGHISSEVPIVTVINIASTRIIEKLLCSADLEQMTTISAGTLRFVGITMADPPRRNRKKAQRGRDPVLTH